MSKVKILEVIEEEPGLRFDETGNTVRIVEKYLDTENDVWEENRTRSNEYYESREIEIIFFREKDSGKITFDFLDWEYWDTYGELGEQISDELLYGFAQGINFLGEDEQERVLCVGDLWSLLGYE